MLAINRTTVINRKAPLNRGLLRWWLCLPKKHGGNRWRELTRKNDATINGATLAGTRGRPGGWGCYAYDGTNDGAQTGTIDLTGTSTLTISFWLWWNAYATNDDLVLETSSDANANTGALFFDPNMGGTSDVLLVVRASGGGFSGVQFARTNAPAAQWNHWVITADRNAGAQQITSVYINGSSISLSNTFTTSDSGSFGNYAWNFMCRNNSSLFGAGRLDDVRIYNRILSASEAQQLYRASRSGYKRELNRQRQVYPGIWEDSAPATPTTRQSTFPYHYRQRRRRRRGIA